MLKCLESRVTRLTRLRAPPARQAETRLQQSRRESGGPIAGRVAIEPVKHRKTRQKSGPGIEAWFLQQHPLIAEPLRLVRSRWQRRRNAIVDPLRLVPLAE